MLYGLVLIAGLYALFTLGMTLLWHSARRPGAASTGSRTRISVLIPVRNEEETLPRLLADLARQSYPANLFEVIVADDFSTDRTAERAERFAASAPFALRLLTLPDERTAAPKKRALAASITRASGDLIVTTDGDCRVGPHWLARIAAFYEETGARLISGPVTFTDEAQFFDYLQTVESSSLIGSGACTLALGIPTMCNGANLAYEKRVFAEVGGFTGVDHVASGDDELLMHKIARRYPDGVRFLKHPDAIVQTGPHRSLSAFYHQRKRWASKWRAYESLLPSLLAVFVFAANAVVPAALLGWAFGAWSGAAALGLLLAKNVPEWLFLGSVLVFLQKRKAVPYILPTQLFYPFYVLFFGLAAQKKGFRWKGRDLN
ncbi:glycosyltransferase family 2 protein [Tellurirhabdus rosea]|uniref:glycosyltransferase family 2 protein n=1 Tax=Tellurirhabdus rosea TaxID=2674997 RepID=UPI00224DC9D2|nr:glycosyltransferase [Tellurirhabdus rosea]